MGKVGEVKSTPIQDMDFAIQEVTTVPSPSNIRRIRQILKQRAIDIEAGEVRESEIQAIEASIKESVSRSISKKFFIVSLKKEILGIVCMSWFGERTQELKGVAQVELKHLYTKQQDTVHGVGRLLVSRVAEEVADLNLDSFALSVGPRYQESRSFFNHILGKPFSMIRDPNSESNDIPVWCQKVESTYPNSSVNYR